MERVPRLDVQLAHAIALDALESANGPADDLRVGAKLLRATVIVAAEDDAARQQRDLGLVLLARIVGEG